MEAKGYRIVSDLSTNVIRQVYICTEPPALPLPNLTISIQMILLHGVMPVMHPVFLCGGLCGIVQTLHESDLITDF